MKYRYLPILFTFVISVLLVTSSSAAPISAYGGLISDDSFTEGSEIRFSGTAHNFSPSPIYLQSFNITFRESLGDSATRDAEILNITRIYEENRQFLGVNGSRTETLIRDVNFEPGPYDVSIFFVYTNDSDVTAASNFGNIYALANASVSITGTTQALEIARWIGYTILAGAIVFVGLLVYNKFKK